MSDNGPILCPSSRCQKGAILLGFVESDGSVAFMAERITINDEFVQIAHEGRTPEKRFRFGGTCVEGACKQWTGKQCGAIEEVLQCVDHNENEEALNLPSCSIRSQCRWYEQRGGLACSVCSFVITDLMVDEKNNQKKGE